MYGEFDLAFQMTSDPSEADLVGDICELKWLERISRQWGAVNIPLRWYADGLKSISLGALVGQPRVVIVRTNKPCEVRWLSSSSGPAVGVQVMNNRYGYLVFSALGASAILYINAMAGTRINLIAIGG